MSKKVLFILAIPAILALQACGGNTSDFYRRFPGCSEAGCGRVALKQGSDAATIASNAAALSNHYELNQASAFAIAKLVSGDVRATLQEVGLSDRDAAEMLSHDAAKAHSAVEKAAKALGEDTAKLEKVVADAKSAANI
jgi:hypothetical protein